MDMFTSHGHIKKLKLNHRFFYDFRLIKSLSVQTTRSLFSLVQAIFLGYKIQNSVTKYLFQKYWWIGRFNQF